MQGTSVGTPAALSAGGESHPKTFEFDSDKFRELIVYVAKESEEDPRFGAVKLNKILYYSDFTAYRQLGRPITGATYRKLSEGPAPAQLLAARRELTESGDASVEERPYFTGVQLRLVISDRRIPDVELFAPGELEIVDSVIEFFEGKTAREVSDFSHREPGWVIADEREVIPYETAWLSSEPISQEIEELALRFVEENEQT